MIVKLSKINFLNSMKKSTFIFVFFILSVLLLKAQSNIYQPFPTANAIWSEYNNFSGTILKNQYAIFGDTSINNLNFHKLYEHQIICMDSSISPTNATLIGALYEDSLKRVYFYNMATNVPCLSTNTIYKIYDFSKQNMGDTIQFGTNTIPFCYNFPYLSISNIDSVLINNSYRKRFHFAEGEVWIEGIGSIRHLLSIITPIPTCSCITELLCHKQNNIGYYQNPTFNYCFCNLGVDVQSLENEELAIYPSPANNYLNVVGKSAQTYQISAITGSIILTGTLTSINNQIDIAALSQGIYFLKIENQILKFEVEK